MKASLRRQLLASHIIPIFLIIPIIGLALIYFIEEYVLLPALANEMVDQGILIGKLTIVKPDIWHDPQVAQSFIADLAIHQPNHIALLNPDGVLLATNQAISGSDGPGIGSVVTNLPAPGPTPNAIRWQVKPGVFSSSPILDVVVPVSDASGNVIGMVRLYRLLSDVSQGLLKVRLIILGILLVDLIISSLIGLVLAETMSRPIRRLTQEIAETNLEGKAKPLPEVGITEVNQLIQTFNRLQDHRFQLETSRRQMLANLVHEIGRPLGGLQAALFALMGGGSDNVDFQKDLLKGMSERVQQMSHLLDDIASSFRKPLNPLDLDCQPVNLFEWVSRQVPIWSEVAHSRSIEWRAEIPTDLPTILVDARQLEQALGNLLSNAFKFTPDGGKVTLKAGATDSIVYFEVKDDGYGISKNDQAKIFEPYFRSITPSWKAPGLGLGLSIACTIVEAHHGKITLDSVPGEGSTFTIILPRQIDTA